MSAFQQSPVSANRLLLQATLALALLVVLSIPMSSVAQHRGGAPGGGGFPGGMHSGEMGGGFPRAENVPPRSENAPSRAENVPSEMNRNSSARMHGSLQVGPPGR